LQNLCVIEIDSSLPNISSALLSKSLTKAYLRSAKDATFISTASTWLTSHPDILKQIRGLSVQDMNFQMTHESQRNNQQKRYQDRVADSLILGGFGGYAGLKDQEKYLKSECHANFNADSDEFKNAVSHADHTYGYEKSPFIYLKRRV
jgi:hypothetical protein